MGEGTGCFQNIPFVSQPDEVAALLSNAIKAVKAPPAARDVAQRIADFVGQRRQTDVPALTHILAGAWPLHPVTTLLLGPVSRQRFAQNERSVFGFISSSEPFGIPVPSASDTGLTARTLGLPDAMGFIPLPTWGRRSRPAPTARRWR